MASVVGSIPGVVFIETKFFVISVENVPVQFSKSQSSTEYIFRLRDKVRPVEVSKQGRTLLSAGELLLSAKE